MGTEVVGGGGGGKEGGVCTYKNLLSIVVLTMVESMLYSEFPHQFKTLFSTTSCKDTEALSQTKLDGSHADLQPHTYTFARTYAIPAHKHAHTNREEGWGWGMGGFSLCCTLVC